MSLRLAALAVVAVCLACGSTTDAEAPPDAVAAPPDASSDTVATADAVASPDVTALDVAPPLDDTATQPLDASPSTDLVTPPTDLDTPPADADPSLDTEPPPDDTGPVVTSPVTQTLTLGGADDAVASYLLDASAGAWNVLGGATVPLGRHWDTAHVSYHAALRFPGAAIPPGAVIDSATLTVFPTNEVDSNHPLWLNVWADASDDSAPFSLANTSSGRPDQRAHTTAGVDHWLIRCNASCTDLTEYDCPQRLKDCWDRETPFTCPKPLAPLIQEVVSRPGWQSGGAITLLLSNAATDEDGAKYQDARAITGDDPERGPAYRPSLTITWHLAP